jgi:hypothetical protein
MFLKKTFTCSFSEDEISLKQNKEMFLLVKPPTTANNELDLPEWNHEIILQ